MKRTLFSTSAIVLGGLIIAVTATPAFAQEAATPTPTPTIKFEELCQRIKNRLNVRVGNVTDAKDKNAAIYEELNKRFETVIDSAKDKEYDTTTMTASLAKTRAAITAYQTANKAYTTELTSTAAGVCKSESGYNVALSSTRVAVKAARTAGIAVRNSFQYDMVPELRKYKVWLTEQSEEATASEPSDDEAATEGNN